MASIKRSAPTTVSTVNGILSTGAGAAARRIPTLNPATEISSFVTTRFWDKLETIDSDFDAGTAQRSDAHRAEVPRNQGFPVVRHYRQ